MTTFSFAQRPLLLMLGLTFSAVATMSAQAQSQSQSQSYRANKPQSGLIVSSASTDSRAGITLRNLTRVLPGFWASTEPSKAYMISSTMVRRAADGSITFMEETGPYKFDPTVTPEVLLKNGPRFVDLLLGHYATQENIGLNELTAALAGYFDSTRPGQGSSIPGGQLMRNSDGSATFTDGKIIFVFDATTSAATVAAMAPTLAAGLTGTTPSPAGGSGSPSGSSGGSSAPSASGSPSGSPGGGNGWGNSSGSPSGSGGNAGSAGAPTSGNNAGSAPGSNPAATGNPDGSTTNPAGSPPGSTAGNNGTPGTPGNNAGYNPQGGVNGQGLNGTAPLSSTGQATMNPNYGVAPAANPCVTFRMLGGGGSSCN